MKKRKYQCCTKGLWNTTIPGITFDVDGISNYYKMFRRLEEEFPKGKKGYNNLKGIIDKIKKQGRNRKYDCIIGMSGGTDSSYMLHLAKKVWGLRPLAVNLDNGWSTDIAVSNIKKITTALNIDLETYVIDYEEVKVVLRAYMKAGMPWIDGPTDIAIKAILYKTAAKEDIKNIFIGDDFRSEGKQPNEWTYSDSKQMRYLCKRYENVALKSFPYMTIASFFYFSFVKGIKVYKPYYYIDYQKNLAQDFLIKEYDWRYYGGHHHENLFTRFAIAYWQLKKFNIDKRIITFSAQVVSGEKQSKDASKELENPPYDEMEMERDRELVIKKLGLNSKEFDHIWARPNKSFLDYPSYYPFLVKNIRIINKFSNYFLASKSKFLILEG